MGSKGLLFIPDISGFTSFVNQTEIEHSHLIIQELLETLINANAIGLEISEIEGDAILFYRFGDPPQLEEIYRQVERMFCDFHRSLMAYAARRYCQCRACIAATDLTLKVITHYGEFTGYNVRTFNQLIGRDIIVAHDLLKNDIADHEYWLVTQSVLPDEQPRGFAPWMEWSIGAKETRCGSVPFRYTQLARLKEAVAPEPLPQAELRDRVRMVSLSREYETDIISLFHATGDFKYRGRWLEGVKEVQEVDHLLPRVGMRCRCLLDDGEVVTFANSYTWGDDRIEFTETDENRRNVTHYLLEKVNEERTRLSIEYYMGGSRAAAEIFRLMRKRQLERRLERSMENLREVANEVALVRIQATTPSVG